MNRFLIVLCLFLLASRAAGQVSLSGIYDFEIKKGGKDSRWESNLLPNDFLQLSVHNFQLFLDAAVDDNISLAAKVATSKKTAYGAGIDLELAYVTFSNIVDNALNLSAGKILTPFGTFTRRQLSPDNPLIGTPLFFSYASNVSSVSGYLDSTGVLLAQSLYGGRLSTVYYGGYFTGLEAFGSFLDGFLSYDFAVMNAPLSSTNPGLNLDREPAYHGRVAVRPAIWSVVGVSYATGSFLERGTVNSVLDAKWSVEDYTQRTIGLDLNLNYQYYELNAEYVLNTFHAPYVVYDFNLNPPYKSGLTGASGLDLKSNEILVDLKIDFPFVPGLYAAGRYDATDFDTITDPSTSSSSFGKKIPWDRDVKRYEVAVGYKAARRVLVKAGYQWTKVDVTPQPRLDIAEAQISVSF